MPDSSPLKLLFICSQNRWRSLTAERLFDGHQNYEARSAGTEPGARVRVTAGHLGWADVVLVMERKHTEILQQTFREELAGKRIINLRIPDTIPFTVPTFTLTNQLGQTITDQTFAGKVYVTDFFFATCPSICPKMQSELLRVYKAYEKDPNVLFLSHTIDPAHDSIPVLRDYAERLGIQDASRWHFATAPHDTIFGLARAYMTGAEVDKQAEGGFAHNGTFALVDSHRRVRGLYDGMVKEEVDRLIKDLPVLLKEEAEQQKVAAQ